jgi:hypothetical protein
MMTAIHCFADASRSAGELYPIERKCDYLIGSPM